MRVRVQFVPRDLWVGVYWRTVYYNGMGSFVRNNPKIVATVLAAGPGWRGRVTCVYVCLVPMLPIVFERTTLLRKS